MNNMKNETCETVQISDEIMTVDGKWLLVQIIHKDGFYAIDEDEESFFISFEKTPIEILSRLPKKFIG
jgi:hypothetical protein